MWISLSSLLSLSIVRGSLLDPEYVSIFRVIELVLSCVGANRFARRGGWPKWLNWKKGRKNFLRHESTRSQCHHKIDTPHCFLITPTAPIVFPIICPSDIMQTFPILPPLARPQMCYILISFPRKICSALVQIQLAGLMKVAKGYDVYWFSLFTFD